MVEFLYNQLLIQRNEATSFLSQLPSIGYIFNNLMQTYLVYCILNNIVFIAVSRMAYTPREKLKWFVCCLFIVSSINAYNFSVVQNREKVTLNEAISFVQNTRDSLITLEQTKITPIAVTDSNFLKGFKEIRSRVENSETDTGCDIYIFPANKKNLTYIPTGSFDDTGIRIIYFKLNLIKRDEDLEYPSALDSFYNTLNNLCFILRVENYDVIPTGINDKYLYDKYTTGLEQLQFY